MRWQRRLAGQANNRAWTLAESPSRTAEEDEEMLQAAHAAMYFWRIAGQPKQWAHAAQLLAHVYALLRLPRPALHYQARSQPVFFCDRAEAWERALAHAVAANVAAAAGDARAHGEHFRQAVQLTASLPEAEDRQIIEATLRTVPAPADGQAHGRA